MFRFSNYWPKARKYATLIHNFNTKHDNCKLDNILRKWKGKFKENNVGEPESSINNILAHVLNTRKLSDIDVNVNRIMTYKQIDKINEMCEMRLQHKPIQYILGEWDFKNLTLKMREPVFIPRPETEQLVDLTLEEIDEDITEVLELCCGSGAISIALLKLNPKIKMFAVDKSREACELTRENAKIHGVSDKIRVIEKTINEQNVNCFMLKKFKLIVCNAPYVPKADMDQLQPEITYEDKDALDGGKDGLDLIKLVLKVSSNVLEPGGKVMLEVDRTHPDLIKSYLLRNPTLGLLITAVHKDIFNANRFVTIKRTKLPLLI